MKSRVTKWRERNKQLMSCVLDESEGIPEQLINEMSVNEMSGSASEIDYNEGAPWSTDDGASNSEFDSEM